MFGFSPRARLLDGVAARSFCSAEAKLFLQIRLLTAKALNAPDRKSVV